MKRVILAGILMLSAGPALTAERPPIHVGLLGSLYQIDSEKDVGGLVLRGGLMLFDQLAAGGASGGQRPGQHR